jgi:hypothetical protein
LYDETNRLFIAGSKFAKNDPRVSKFIPALEKMGEKAPVMKLLAQKYNTLVDAVPESATEALLDAGGFLYSVLATQGETAVSGEISEDKPFITSFPKSQMPHSRIRPVADALTSSGQGHYNVVAEAYNAGVLDDFRLYAPLASALDHSYSELADFVGQRVIPRIGAVMIPYILSGYDGKSAKKSDVRRLELLDSLGYEGVEELARAAAENGGADVAAAGIRILGKNKDNEKYLIQLAGDKKSAVREAALAGLMRMDSSEGKELMLKTLGGAKYKSAVEAASLCADSAYSAKIVGVVRASFTKETADKFEDLLRSLRNKTDDVVYDFFKEILKNKELPQHDQKLIFVYLIENGIEKGIGVFEEIWGKNPCAASYYFQLAKKFYTPDKLFKVFSKVYESSDNDICYYYFGYLIDGVYRKIGEMGEVLSPKWKKLFIKKNDVVGIAATTCGDPKETEKLLTKCLESGKLKWLEANAAREILKELLV